MHNNGANAVRSDAARAEQLQFLRFLAFTGVYIFHTENYLTVSLPISHLGSAAVSFFFILSGLVTGWSGYGRPVDLSLCNQGRYMWRKIKKIYPLYFLTTMLAVINSQLPSAVAGMDPEVLRSPLTLLVKNLLLIQSWFSGDGFSYNGSAWFLSTLLFLNLWNLPLLALFGRVEKKRWRYLFWLFGSLGLTAATVVFCYMTQHLEMGYWHYRFPPVRLGEYICGMMLGFVLRDLLPKIPRKQWVTILFTALEIFALVFWLMALPHAGNYWRNHIISWLKPNFLLLTVFGFGLGWVSRLFRWKPLVALGDMAFECFLIHMVFVNYLQFLHPQMAASEVGKVFAFLFCFGLTILMAVMLRGKKK